MARRIALVGIDFQNDFMDDGALPVMGAKADAHRLASMIDRLGKKLDDIYMTLDSHDPVHIAHGISWVDQDNNHPDPFTVIESKDIIPNDNSRWFRSSVRAWNSRYVDYVNSLEQNGRYKLCIWAEHCIVGTPGHNIEDTLRDSLMRWERNNYRKVYFKVKGNNPFTEHYSAVKADVPDPNDPTTQLDTGFVQILNNYDEVVCAGEALDFCVRNTFLDVVDFWGAGNNPFVQKMVFLTDASSPVTVGGNRVTNFDFVAELAARGMRVATTDSYLS